MSPLPPGIDSGIEIWADSYGQVFILKEGSKTALKNVDRLTYAILLNDMNNHPHAQACMDIMGIYDTRDQLQKYLACRYGNFDTIPDFAPNGIINTDYYKCGNRGACKFEGKLCDKIRVKNGYLTPQEIQVIKLVAEDLCDKEVANKLDISPNTVSTHIQNILEKLDVHSRVGICRFVIEHNL